MNADQDRMLDIANVSRRRFLQGSAAGALVLAVGLSPLRAFAQAEQKYGADACRMARWTTARLRRYRRGWRGHPHLPSRRDGVRVCVPASRSCLQMSSKPTGRASRSSRAWGDETRFGNQDTDGSRSLRRLLPSRCVVAGGGRAMLEAAAAARWGVDVDTVHAYSNEVVHQASGRRLGYGELASRRGPAGTPRSQLPLKETPGEFRYRQGVRSVSSTPSTLTTGRARYGIDTVMPGLLFAVIARPPVYGGKVAKFDSTDAMKIAGVVRVLEIPGTPPPSGFDPVGGVAVVARNTWTAMQGRNALKITWDDGPNATYSSDTYKSELQAHVRKPGRVVRTQGDVAAALQGAAKRVAAEYYVPHIAHATMEPPAAVARVADGKCEAWACVQGPQAARDRVAKNLGIPLESVTIHQTLLGGGFGRKSKPDFVVEAALLSKAMDGVPVKVTWTREDDIHNDYFNTVAVERIEAGLDGAGHVVGWLHRRRRRRSSRLCRGPEARAFSELEGPHRHAFAIPNLRSKTPKRWAYAYRMVPSVFNIPHAFAIQSFVAELAAAAGRDQKDFLLELIGPARKIDPRQMKAWNYNESPELYPVDTDRWRRVVEFVAERAEWGRKVPARHGLGIAAHYSFVTYTAAVVEAAVNEKGEITVPRVDIAIDCGPQVNPERIRSQLEGAVIMGLGVALRGGITFKDGKVEQNNFDGYTVLRINEVPRDIRVHLLPGTFGMPLGGVGEPGVPPIAPALCNAIFAASGRRVRPADSHGTAVTRMAQLTHPWAR
jgi:isoquinoline 1-oxidoreductase beta subunit